MDVAGAGPGHGVLKPMLAKVEEGELEEDELQGEEGVVQGTQFRVLTAICSIELSLLEIYAWSL